MPYRGSNLTPLTIHSVEGVSYIQKGVKCYTIFNEVLGLVKKNVMYRSCVYRCVEIHRIRECHPRVKLLVYMFSCEQFVATSGWSRHKQLC